MINLVMIDCHDMGQHIGAYGWKTVPSKNLDALAARGVRFENSFCTAPQCSPSRAGLYTGRYAHANGMFGLAHSPFNWRLHENEIHLAQHLRQAGYTTTLIGTQHVTENKIKSIKELGYQEAILLEKPQEVGEQVKQFLAKAPQAPFFLNIGFVYPHRDKHGQFKQVPADNSLGIEVPPYLPNTPEARQEVAEFQGVIAEMDRAIGEIWAALTQSGLLKNTWLIFTTDHGIAMPRAKCTLFDPGIEVALITYAEPFGLTGGRVIDDLISNVDLVPTILEMLEIEVPDTIQGKSFAALLRNQPYTSRQEVFAEKTFHTTYEPLRAIRTNRYKLIWNVEAGILNVPGDIMHSPIFPQMIEQITQERPYYELYDLTQDPLERNNLALHPEYRQIFNDLRERLLSWMRETGDPLLQGPIASPFYEQGLATLQGNDALKASAHNFYTED